MPETRQEKKGTVRDRLPFRIDKDKLIKSMFRISTFMAAPHMDGLTHNLFFDDFHFESVSL
ncbi:MAG: hypothetical protein PHW43_10785, partial [Syntrophales bacterium]|nr:hypothetical protein [Syntrophales bacterium]